MDSKLSPKRKTLKVLPIPTALIPTIKAKILDSTYLDDNEKITAITHVAFKGESYILAVRERKKAPNFDKYKELARLKTFLGTKGSESLESWNSSLSPRTVKFAMKQAIASSTTTRHALFRADNKGLTGFRRVRSEIQGMSDTLEYLRSDWTSTVSGRKAAKRVDGKYTRTNRKRIFGDVYSTMVGGVHTESGLYLKAYKEKMTRILDTNKKPMTQERHVGIEMEFLLPHVNKAAVKESLMASPYAKMLCLTRDGSVTSNSTYDPAELKICAPQAQIANAVSFVSMVLAANNCAVDKSCGLHVHLDARNDDARSMFDKLLGHQATLFALVPASRRDNQYCRRTTKKDYCRGSRYKSINSTAYNKFKTLEVRLHGGTIDPNKIINWVSLLTTIAYNPVEITKSRTVTNSLKKLNLPAAMVGYFLEREQKFLKA
jgi:hypothetical protein